jgi:hypothetical protein
VYQLQRSGNGEEGHIVVGEYRTKTEAIRAGRVWVNHWRLGRISAGRCSAQPQGPGNWLLRRQESGRMEDCGRLQAIRGDES